MSGSDATMVDRAYWDPAMLTAAQQAHANAINVYAWDHYLNDVNGYCGGFTPEVVAQIYAAGYDVHATFCFRDGEAPLDPATCVSILQKLGVKKGAWVHNDIENGAMDSLAHDLAFNQAMHAAGYRPAPYGLPSTLRAGYLQDAEGAWVASYVRAWDNQPPLVDVPNVGAWTYIGWQFSLNSPPAITVDVSVHNFPAATEGIPVERKLMTRDDWAAIWRFIFTLTNRVPAMQPVGYELLGEHYYWADHTHDVGPDRAMMDYLTELAKERPDLPLPLHLPQAIAGAPGAKGDPGPAGQPGPSGPQGPAGGVSIQDVRGEISTAFESVARAVRGTAN